MPIWAVPESKHDQRVCLRVSYGLSCSGRKTCILSQNCGQMNKRHRMIHRRDTSGRRRSRNDVLKQMTAGREGAHKTVQWCRCCSCRLFTPDDPHIVDVRRSGPNKACTLDANSLRLLPKLLSGKIDTRVSRCSGYIGGHHVDSDRRESSNRFFFISKKLIIDAGPLPHRSEGTHLGLNLHKTFVWSLKISHGVIYRF